MKGGCNKESDRKRVRSAPGGGRRKRYNNRRNGKKRDEGATVGGRRWQGIRVHQVE